MLGFIGSVRVVGGRGSRRGTAVCMNRPPPKGPQDDENVPEGHRGLHESLYGNGAEAEHGRAGLRAKTIEFDERRRYAVDEVIVMGEMGEGAKVAGVYAVQDSKGRVLYVGISRDVLLNISAHRTMLGSDTVRHCYIKTVSFPSREDLEAIRNEWIEALEEVPPGNGPDRERWVSSVRDAAKVAHDEQGKQEFEEKKIKLRKAMGEVTVDDESAALPEDMRAAMEQDDWSAVVSKQTEATKAPSSPAPAAAIESPIESPFAQEKGAAAAKGNPKGPLPLTMETCNTVLDEVRPYLVADGGNVKVLSVDGGDVKVLLEGACGTCPSSTTTMKMGIEKVLQENFAEFKSVTAVSDAAEALGSELSVALCDHVLDQVRPAITGLGGLVQATKAEGNEIVLRYTGPEKLAYGIELMLRDKFPTVGEIRFDG